MNPSFQLQPLTSDSSQTTKAAKADVFIVVNASTIELVDVENYVKEVVGDRPVITFNVELDTLRADLGADFNETF